MPTFNRYVTIDGNRYPVLTGTYSRKWARAFSSQLAGNIIRLNFVDRGPGIRTYNFSVIIKTWRAGSTPYDNGITAAWNVQMQNLEASYAKVATPVQFVDPFGFSPGPNANYGVFFTNLTQMIPNYSTPQTPYVIYDVELTEATQVIA